MIDTEGHSKWWVRVDQGEDDGVKAFCARCNALEDECDRLSEQLAAAQFMVAELDFGAGGILAQMKTLREQLAAAEALAAEAMEQRDQLAISLATARRDALKDAANTLSDYSMLDAARIIRELAAEVKL